MSQEQKTVIITGMHRSATSFIANVLQEAGLNIGDELLGPARGNIRGHFEDVDFFHFHEDLLKRLGHTMFVQSAVDIGEIQPTDIEQAKALIAQRSNHPFWGWKEPRTSLFLDFWYELLPDQSRFVLVYRHPVEVVLSLMRRGHYEVLEDFHIGLNSWQVHNQSIIKFYRQHPDICFLGRTSAITSDIDTYVSLVAQKLALPLQENGNKVQFHPTELKQINFSEETTSLLTTLIPQAMHLFQALEAAADLPGDKPEQLQSDESFVDLAEVAANLASYDLLKKHERDQLFSLVLAKLAPEIYLETQKAFVSVARSAQVRTLQSEINGLEQQLNDKETQLETLRQHVSDYEIIVENLNHGIVDKETLIAGLEQQIVDKEAKLEELLQKINIHNETVDNLKQQLLDQKNHISKLNQEAADYETRLTQVIKVRDTSISELERQVARERSSTKELEQDIAAKIRQIGRLQQELSDRNNHIQNLEEKLERENSVNSDLQRQISQKNSEIGFYQEQINLKDQAIEILDGSISLRIGRHFYPLREFGERLIESFRQNNHEVGGENQNKLGNNTNNNKLVNNNYSLQLDPQLSEGVYQFTNGIPHRTSHALDKKVAFVLPCGLILGGVTTWSIEMCRRLANRNIPTALIKHPDFGIPLDISIPKNVVQIDTDCHPTPQAQDLLRCIPQYYESLPGIIIPNYDVAPYAACASMSIHEAEDFRVVGICHTDESFYYALLQYYEPIIHFFIAVSQEAARNLEKLMPHRKNDIAILPYGVNVPGQFEHTYSASGRPLQLLYAGRLVERQKRVFDLVKLVQELTRSKVDFHLKIVGDGEQGEELRNRLLELDENIQQRVTMMGAVPPNKMPELWQSADLCVLVSKFEGTSVSMLEGMAFGCVPVVPRVSGMEAVLNYGSNGFTFPVGDIEAMARIIKHIDQDREILPPVGRQAYATILERYSYEKYVNAFLDLIDPLWQQPARIWPLNRDPLLEEDDRIALEIRIRDQLSAMELNDGK
ncbi:MAG: glycosyltransferase [Anaerolineales bacterium]